jgi:hypothetical protein
VISPLEVRSRSVSFKMCSVFFKVYEVAMSIAFGMVGGSTPICSLSETLPRSEREFYMVCDGDNSRDH